MYRARGGKMRRSDPAAIVAAKWYKMRPAARRRILRREERGGSMGARKVWRSWPVSRTKWARRVSRRGPAVGGAERGHKEKSNVVFLGKGGGLTPCPAATMGSTKEVGMEGKRRRRVRMPWFGVDGARRRRRGRRRGLGAVMAGAAPAGGRSVGGVLTSGAAIVAGAAAGSVLAAKVPLPGALTRWRPVLPIAVGVGLGVSRFGRKRIVTDLALGMIAAGGLALGRLYAPQLFAGDDEMLGLDAATDEALGLTYAGDDRLGLTYEGDEVEGDEVEGDEVEGEEVEGEDVAGANSDYLGAFATSADA